MMANGALTRVLLEMCVSKWNEVFTPGYKMKVDESMFAWYGRTGMREEVF